MASYVEVNPGDAASAANRLLNASTDLQNDNAPPDPESVGWGEDEFGEWMRSEYLKAVDGGACLPDRCVEEKHNIGGRCGELGDGIHQAMHDFELQEMVNTHRMETSGVESEGTDNGGGSTGGAAPTTTPLSTPAPTDPAPTTTPLSNPAPTNPGPPGEPSTHGVEPDEPADESAPGVMVVGRMFRALQQPVELEPSADEEEPERHAFLARLLRPETVAETETETDHSTEPGRMFHTRWLVDPIATESASETEPGPEAGADPVRMYRSRWMVDPTADTRPDQTDDTSPQE